MKPIEPREHIADDERDPLDPPRFGRSDWRERAREKKAAREPAPHVADDGVRSVTAQLHSEAEDRDVKASELLMEKLRESIRIAKERKAACPQRTSGT